MATNQTQLQIVIDAVNRAGGAFSSIGRELDQVSSQTRNLRSGMMAVGAAGAAATAALGFVAKGAIQAGADFEQTQVAFSTMLGSAEKAKDVLAELARFSASTPFQLPQVQEAAKQLLAYGFSTKELIPTLTDLGNVAAGLNIPMSDMTYLFGTLRTQGRAFSKDIYQFSARGIPILDELAKVLGVSKSEVMGLVEEGRVGFPEVEQAFRNMNAEGGQFYNLMDAQSRTLAGQWSNFKDQITLTAISIGSQLLPYLKPVVEKLIELAHAVGDFVKQHPQLSAYILMFTLGMAGILALLLPIAIALPGLIVMFGLLGGALAAVTAISAPLLLAVGAIIAVLTLLAANGYTTKQAWEQVWLGIKITAAEAANAVISTVEGMINFVIGGVNKAIAAINKVISAANKVPGVRISSIGKIDTVSLGKIDTDTIAKSSIIDTVAGSAAKTAVVQMSGNVFLDPSVAEKIGDMILSKLKLSNAL